MKHISIVLILVCVLLVAAFTGCSVTTSNGILNTTAPPNLEQQCQGNGNLWCNNQCYSQCPSGETYNCPTSGGATCITPKPQPSSGITNYTFQTYKNQEPYYSNYCDKINPYDLSVRQAAAEAIRNGPGSYSESQLFDIYDWVKSNIEYQNVPSSGIPYPPNETLATGSGDCKNQAVLIDSMIEAIGGTAEVVVDTSCTHAYTIVYFGSAGTDLSSFTQAVADHYAPSVEVNYFTMNDDIWVIFDPAGGYYPGDTLPECSGDRTVYLVDSCRLCVNQYPNTPYTYGDSCYSQCPSGTISTNNYACSPCPAGSYSFNNQCVTCPSGYYLATNGRCYPN